MIVMATVHVDISNSEGIPELLENEPTSFALHHRVLYADLVSSSVSLPAPKRAFPVGDIRLLHEPDREASFSVGEPDDPVGAHQPFLLIVRLLTSRASATESFFTRPPVDNSLHVLDLRAVYHT